MSHLFVLLAGVILLGAGLRIILYEGAILKTKADGGNMESLLELLMKKGNGVCSQFVSMLQEDDEVKQTFPRLAELDFSRIYSRSPPPGPSTQTQTRGMLRDIPPNTTQGFPKTKNPGWQTVQGFVKDVSEMITRKVEFFKIVMETETEGLLTVRVFIPSKRKDFIIAKEENSLVLLEKMGIYEDCPNFNEYSEFRVLKSSPTKKVKGSKGKANLMELQITPSPLCDPQPPPMKVTIAGVRLKEMFCCPKDHPLTDKSWKCKTCRVIYNKVDTKRVLSGTVLVREIDPVLELTDFHIRTLLKKNMGRGCETVDKLEAALKRVRIFQVTLNQDGVISVSRTSPSGS